jgi:arylsulfatase A-like enzyme
MIKKVVTPAKFLAKDHLLSFLMALTAFFVLAQISFVLECSGLYFDTFELVARHLQFPLVILPSILFFILAQLSVHIGFTLCVWIIAKQANKILRLTPEKLEKWGIIFWFVTIVTVLLANLLYFPNSKFAMLTRIFHHHLAVILFISLLCVIACVIILALIGFAREFRYKKYGLILSVLAIIFFGFYPKLHPSRMIADGGTTAQPNIIIIGIDSLRPDQLSIFGYPELMPHLDDFLNLATVFSDALTPLARTYPSWVGILTGLYPKINSVRTNLADQQNLNLTDTLPAILQKHGYATIFATDETRFSNIDQHFGFDSTVTPPMGVKDFLLGAINDFPISNLLINTFIGKIIFPESYGNRAVSITYEPESFLNLVMPVLKTPRTKPLFLTVHFCLPHYPFAWAGLFVKKTNRFHYQQALKKVDEQFAQFMQMLEQNNLLKHSIVIVLSDHGEGLERPGDRITDPQLFQAGASNTLRIIPHFYPPAAINEKVDQAVGHGTDVLGLSQFHALLAMRTFGLNPNAIANVPGMVSLLDIKPTILDYLHLPRANNLSGKTLLPALTGQVNYFTRDHDFFTESDFSPEAIRTVHPEMRKVLFEGIEYFRIDPLTARVIVRPNMLKMIIASKQYADFYQQWVLALYPRQDHDFIPILVNLTNGYWTNDLHSAFALASPAQRMLEAMHAFYGTDLAKLKITHA